jgi:hypothetical protein
VLKSLFRRQRFLEAGLEEWCFEAWTWLMRNLGGTSRLAATPLAQASADFFPPTDTAGAARGEYLFERVKVLMGMSDWDCELQAIERRTETRVGEFWHLRSGGAAAGTFQIADNRVVISYAADLAQQPRALIAVLAHELSHYRLATVVEPPPGEALAHELLTDLTVAYAGFGVFAANAAFAFQQGWSPQRQGYLSKRTWAFAIALFLTLKDEPGAARKGLKPNIADMSAKAEKYLARRQELLAPLRAIA